MGVSEIRGTVFWVLIIRILLFRVLYWGPLIFGNSHLGLQEALRGSIGFVGLWLLGWEDSGPVA